MYTNGFWTSLNTGLNAFSDILLLIVIFLLLILFNKLGFFKRKLVMTPVVTGNAEIVKWSPIDKDACTRRSVMVQDDLGNIAIGRYEFRLQRWVFADGGGDLPFVPTEYRSSNHS